MQARGRATFAAEIYQLSMVALNPCHSAWSVGCHRLQYLHCFLALQLPIEVCVQTRALAHGVHTSCKPTQSLFPVLPVLLILAFACCCAAAVLLPQVEHKIQSSDGPLVLQLHKVGSLVLVIVYHSLLATCTSEAAYHC
jgi:hypothetical protein